MHISSSARLTRYEVAMLAFKDIRQRDMDFAPAVPTVGIG